MSARLERLRAEIRSDRQAFEAQVGILESLDLPLQDPGDVARAALALHHAYSAVETLLLRIARELDGGDPVGPDWHQALLDSMALDIPGVRPAVVSHAARAHLHALLAFRHFLRHAYSVPLDAAQLAEIVPKAIAARGILADDLHGLDAFLAELAGRPS